ncbi:MAG: transcription antitermination factor NusB [Verrucomicrobiales bacterium]
MGKRREGREAAVQFLFCSDINQELTPSDIDGFFSTIRPASPRVREFAKVLATGVCERRAEVDVVIEENTDNYQLDRISAVDRSILRLAVYEMMFCDDIPNVVSINEAIEVAKRFGTEDSGRFVNGILDNLNRALRKSSQSDRPGTSAAEADA